MLFMDYAEITRHVIDRLGVAETAAINGVQPLRVKRVIKLGVMPAEWAVNIRAAAAELSPPLLVPDQCFTFRGVGK